MTRGRGRKKTTGSGGQPPEVPTPAESSVGVIGAVTVEIVEEVVVETTVLDSATVEEPSGAGEANEGEVSAEPPAKPARGRGRGRGKKAPEPEPTEADATPDREATEADGIPDREAGDDGPPRPRERERVGERDHEGEAEATSPPADADAESSADASPPDGEADERAPTDAGALEALRVDPDADTEDAPLDTDARPGLEKAPPLLVSDKHLETVIESLLFVSDKPLTPLRVARLARTSTKEAARIIEQLAKFYEGRGLELAEVAGGWQFRSSAASAPFVRDLVAKKPVRLTRAQIETLAICAYRQPITRPEVDEIRGVDSGSAIKILVEKSLVKILGRRDEPGRPLLYGTTPHFLEFFGLPSLAELPTLREHAELSDESRELFERRMGESIDTIADIEGDTHHYTDEEIEAAEAAARVEGDEPQADLPLEGDAASTPGAVEDGASAPASSDDEDDEDDEDEDDDDEDDEDDEDEDDDDEDEDE